jgi:hypothetical protein
MNNVKLCLQKILDSPKVIIARCRVVQKYTQSGREDGEVIHQTQKDDTERMKDESDNAEGDRYRVRDVRCVFISRG